MKSFLPKFWKPIAGENEASMKKKKQEQEFPSNIYAFFALCPFLVL